MFESALIIYVFYARAIPNQVLWLRMCVLCRKFTYFVMTPMSWNPEMVIFNTFKVQGVE